MTSVRAAGQGLYPEKAGTTLGTNQQKAIYYGCCQYRITGQDRE
ncbi:MAG TPA: hypothetical protein PLI94_01870 [Bacillota bacterium]|jgi:hypothetical protein|nr:hypothetical protein [Bacillota bacterium]HPT66768.1 hypothetical protein [Bacillota bacterium]